MAKAAVLPVPVRAWPNTSSPESALGIIPACTGVGSRYAARASAASIVSERPRSPNPPEGAEESGNLVSDEEGDKEAFRVQGSGFENGCKITVTRNIGQGDQVAREANSRL